MALSKYHLKHVNRSNEEQAGRGKAKEIELKKILDYTKWQPGHEPVRIAVMGCADKRFVQQHRDIFAKFLSKKTELTTFDITLEHLQGERDLVQHDLTNPLPGGPFDITFAHVLLKFIGPERQFDVVKNSYDALRAPGLAIHVFDEHEVTSKDERLHDGCYPVSLDRIKEKLVEHDITFEELRWEIDTPDAPTLIRGAKGGALILIK